MYTEHPYPPDEGEEYGLEDPNEPIDAVDMLGALTVTLFMTILLGKGVMSIFN